MKLKKPKSQTKDVENAADFISEAEARGTHQTTVFPWEEVNPKQSKAFNLRLPLDLHEKLKYLAENTPRTSMNNICIDGLEPYVDELIQQLLKKK